MGAVQVDERADFNFIAGDLDANDLRVTSFHGVEGISQLGGFRIELTSSDPDVDFDALVGEKACLAWKGVEEIRWMHGIVSRFEITGQGRDLTYYSALLVPHMWLLTRRWQSRIFQNLATPDILKKVFEGGGLPSDEFKISLKRSYKPRKYCVQYRESDMDFASRLMEEEGIFYWFEHTEDGHVLYVADDASAHEPVAGETTFPFRPGDVAASDGDDHAVADAAADPGRWIHRVAVTGRSASPATQAGGVAKEPPFSMPKRLTAKTVAPLFMPKAMAFGRAGSDDASRLPKVWRSA